MSDIFQFVESVDEDGAPILRADAPDICENGPFPNLGPWVTVAILDLDGGFLATSTSGWAAREVLKGRARQVGIDKYRMVPA